MECTPIYYTDDLHCATRNRGSAGQEEKGGQPLCCPPCSSCPLARLTALSPHHSKAAVVEAIFRRLLAYAKTHCVPSLPPGYPLLHRPVSGLHHHADHSHHYDH